MIELVATAESVSQGKSLLDTGIDKLYIGEDFFGLRLPHSFQQAEIQELTEYAHQQGKQVCVAVNAIIHNERIDKIKPYLSFLAEIQVDQITVGDPGVIHILKKSGLKLPFVYDAQIMVTSAKQVNFWVKRGAAGAILAREITLDELKIMAPQVEVPLEILVYGATCIHQSKRPLVENYLNFVKEDISTEKERGLYISEPRKDETHYSVYEDINGTHIFATNDVNLMEHLGDLYELGLTEWKLDGIYTKGENFVKIAALFVKAKEAFNTDSWNEVLMNELNQELLKLHPENRELDTGFFLLDPSTVK